MSDRLLVRPVVLAVWAQQPKSRPLGQFLELFTGEAFVRQQDLTFTERVVVVREQGSQDLAFTEFRVRLARHHMIGMPPPAQVR